MFLDISQNSQENTCVRVSLLIALQTWGLQRYQKESLAKVLSCEFCKIFMNTFFTEHLRATASAASK